MRVKSIITFDQEQIHDLNYVFAGALWTPYYLHKTFWVFLVAYFYFLKKSVVKYKKEKPLWLIRRVSVVEINLMGSLLSVLLGGQLLVLMSNSCGQKK